jgi:hypothetical protein
VNVTKRARLTPHQREVYDRIVRFAARTGYINAKFIGSRGAVEHLTAKGYVRLGEEGRLGSMHCVIHPIEATS